MILVLSERPNEAMAIDFEALKFSHVLRSGVLGHCLEKGVQKSVVIVSTVKNLEPHVAYTRQS